MDADLAPERLTIPDLEDGYPSAVVQCFPWRSPHPSSRYSPRDNSSRFDDNYNSSDVRSSLHPPSPRLVPSCLNPPRVFSHSASAGAAHFNRVLEVLVWQRWTRRRATGASVAQPGRRRGEGALGDGLGETIATTTMRTTTTTRRATRGNGQKLVFHHDMDGSDRRRGVGSFNIHDNSSSTSTSSSGAGSSSSTSGASSTPSNHLKSYHDNNHHKPTHHNYKHHQQNGATAVSTTSSRVSSAAGYAPNHDAVTCERVVRIVSRAETGRAAAPAAAAVAAAAPAFSPTLLVQGSESHPASQAKAPLAAASPPASFLCLLEKGNSRQSKQSPLPLPAVLHQQETPRVAEASYDVLAEEMGERAQSAEGLGARAELAEGQLDLAELQARVVGSQLQLLRGMLAEREEQVSAVMTDLAEMRARVVHARSVAERNPSGMSRSRSTVTSACADVGKAGNAGATPGTREGPGGPACALNGQEGYLKDMGKPDWQWELQTERNGRNSFSVPVTLANSRRTSTDQRPRDESQERALDNAGGQSSEMRAVAPSVDSACVGAAAELQQVEMAVASTEAWLWEVEAAAAEAREVLLQAEEEAALSALAAIGAVAGDDEEGGGGRAIHSAGFRHQLALSERAFTEELYRRLKRLQADLIEGGQEERVLLGSSQVRGDHRECETGLLLTRMGDGDGVGMGEGDGLGIDRREEGGEGVRERKGLSFWERINGDEIMKKSLAESKAETTAGAKYKTQVSSAFLNPWGAEGRFGTEQGSSGGFCGVKPPFESHLQQQQQDQLLQHQQHQDEQAQQKLQQQLWWQQKELIEHQQQQQLLQQRQQQQQQQQLQQQQQQRCQAVTRALAQEDSEEEALILQQAMEYLRKEVQKIKC